MKPFDRRERIVFIKQLLVNVTEWNKSIDEKQRTIHVCLVLRWRSGESRGVVLMLISKAE